MTAPFNQNAQGATLLVVDDDANMRRKLRRIFEEAGYRTVTAEDAPSALRLLHKERCDLVMLDVEMPGVSGLALCRLLRAQAATRQLPVVIFSASDDENRKVEAFTAGADDYIVKPSTPRELLSRINAHLESAQQTRALLGSNRELQFLADLGRGLLRALEPEQVVRRVAGATYEGTNAALCAAAIRSDSRGPVICVFDREGSAEGLSLIHMERLNAWLDAGGPPARTALIEDAQQFLLLDEGHALELVAPLSFGGRTQGALIACFDAREDCGGTEARLVEAAAQQAALAAHISSLYAAARESSVNLAKEVERQTATLEAQRRLTEAIIDSLPLSLYAIDRGYRIVAWNRNRELGGQGIPRQDALGRNIFEVLTRQRRNVLEREFARAFETGEIERIEQEAISPDGKTRHWLVSKIPMRAEEGAEVSHVITVGEDITERVEASRAVARAEKLAAIGRLAAGVVHEINNPLATISACAEALETRVREGAFDASSEVADLREYLELIRSEAFRCKMITNGLLDFSRTRAGQHVPLSILEVIKAAARLLVHQKRGPGVEIRVEAADDVAVILGDEGQLQQAVIALATNGIDAMPEGGLLTIGARNEDGHVLVQVSDTGIGIAPENLVKIFDPFFTTKEVGRGTGLGLAVCYGIVTEHGGRLDVQSAVGVGTTFTISLPAMILTHGEQNS
ncbi:MAG TPA: response regulator [Pyrinomonadaceae bacterium]|jgi:two-component system NtrC family sensor kinase